MKEIQSLSFTRAFSPHVLYLIAMEFLTDLHGKAYAVRVESASTCCPLPLTSDGFIDRAQAEERFSKAESKNYWVGDITLVGEFAAWIEGCVLIGDKIVLNISRQCIDAITEVTLTSKSISHRVLFDEGLSDDDSPFCFHPEVKWAELLAKGLSEVFLVPYKPLFDSIIDHIVSDMAEREEERRDEMFAA